MAAWTIGIIGGSGLYAIDAMENAQWIRVNTPWGDASDEVLCGEIAGARVRFLPRHGRGHRLPPADVNARANIDALKRAGCTDIVAISAVGSLREDVEPGQFVIVDQFIDRTRGRPASFFGPGMVAHVSIADPVCPRLSDMAGTAIEAIGGTVSRGKTYLAMEGPQFSTRAESQLYRAWGADVIGMTGMPEARLAREAELPYASIGMVTDYDSWRADAAPVEAGDVLTRVKGNADRARAAIAALFAALPQTREASPIDVALDRAIMTPPADRDPALLARLDAVAGRIL